MGELVTGDAERIVTAWSSRGDAVRTYGEYPGPIQTLGFSPDGTTLYAITSPHAGHPASVVTQDRAGKHIYEADSEATRLHAEFAEFTSVAFDHRRGRVLASSWDQRVRIWDQRTGALVDKLVAAFTLEAVVMSPDDAVIVGIGGSSPTVWDAETRAQLGLLEGHGDWVLDAGFIADSLLVTSSRDGTARAWDIRTRQPLLVIQGVDALEGALAISNDRATAVLSGVKGTTVWRPTFSPACTSRTVDCTK
jgi:WD40 repeat protein